MTKTITCPVCGGKGYFTDENEEHYIEGKIYFSKITCEECDGEGVIEIDNDDPWGEVVKSNCSNLNL